MKTKLYLLLAAAAISGSAFAADSSARLTAPKHYSHRDLPAFAPAQPVSGGCQTMLVTTPGLKGVAAPRYVDCKSAAVRNTAECKRMCGRE
ncbi:MAG: hypothetical protein U0984_12380 [Prosthecobacter sp.]|nr:hypothetical protein [Prosthecobacter sp.]